MSEQNPTVLVVGATGRVASLVVPALRKRGLAVRALVRTENEGEIALSTGATHTVLGDLRSLQSLVDAASGANGIFHIGPAFEPDEAQMGCNMVRAAELAKVKKFVFSSVIQPTHERLANHRSKIPVESALFESDLEYTILHPANFFQNLRGAWPAISKLGIYAEPNPVTTKIARVDYRDVAEVVALAFSDSRLAYGSFELCSEGLYSRLDIAEMASKALDRPVQACEVSFSDWVESTKPPFDDSQLRLLAKVHEHYSAHGLSGNALTLRAILGHEPRSLPDYIGELAQL
jgi:uncharacterized protein YbjT (DUF2867 family)